VPQDIDLHFGRRLRWRRRMMDLTLADVARGCGVGFQQIQKYESATNHMSAAMLWKIASILEVDVAYFYEGLERADFESSDARPSPGATSPS